MNRRQRRIIIWSGISIVLLILLGTDFDPSRWGHQFPIIPTAVSISLCFCIAILGVILVFVSSGPKEVEQGETRNRPKLSQRLGQNLRDFIKDLGQLIDPRIPTLTRIGRIKKFLRGGKLR
jgi:hypothetical protein